MKFAFAITGSLAAALAVSPLHAAQATASSELARALADSAAGWSSGDINRFMRVYDRQAIYVAGERVVAGYDAIRAIYAPRFTSKGKGMGRLSVDLLNVRELPGGYAYLIGRYHLRYAEKPEATGLTTLLFRKTKVGWRILSDHSG